MTKTIVILHGWGKTGANYHEIQKIFEKKGFTVYAPDLPGFGDTKLKKSSLFLDDYIQFVVDFYKYHNIKKAIIVAHSFGGRVAAKLAVKHPEMIEKLILTGAPLIKQPLSVRKKLIVGIARIGKVSLGIIHIDYKNLRKYIYYFLGEWDYYNANNMREIFKNIIAEDLSPNLRLIQVPTVVIWGGNDTFVGKKLGKKIAKEIPRAIYKEIDGASHRLPYEESKKFADAVLQSIP